MRTRTSHVADGSTIQALVERKKAPLALGQKEHSWRSLAVDLGYDESYATTLCAIHNDRSGACTLAGENILRARLGQPPLYTIPVPPCPDCGGIHTGRCHGRTVIEVAVLGPDEVVRRRRPESPAWVKQAAALLKQAAEERLRD